MPRAGNQQPIEHARILIPASHPEREPVLEMTVPVGAQFYLWEGPEGWTTEECEANSMFRHMDTIIVRPLWDTVVYVTQRAPVQFRVLQADRSVLWFKGKISRRDAKTTPAAQEE
jgi:hypothetical protein